MIWKNKSNDPVTGPWTQKYRILCYCKTSVMALSRSCRDWNPLNGWNGRTFEERTKKEIECKGRADQ